jgi:hypothetical protein
MTIKTYEPVEQTLARVHQDTPAVAVEHVRGMIDSNAQLAAAGYIDERREKREHAGATVETLRARLCALTLGARCAGFLGVAGLGGRLSGLGFLLRLGGLALALGAFVALGRVLLLGGTLLRGGLLRRNVRALFRNSGGVFGNSASSFVMVVNPFCA